MFKANTWELNKWELQNLRVRKSKDDAKPHALPSFLIRSLEQILVNIFVIGLHLRVKILKNDIPRYFALLHDTSLFVAIVALVSSCST